jgi:nicotinate phosphoribosyltransferase
MVSGAASMSRAESALLTDLYQLTMARAYHQLGMQETAVFEVFVRALPAARGFLIAAGLDQVIAYLETLHFTPADLEFLAGLNLFPGDFLDYLGTVRFTGTIHAMPEGTPYFANEPVLRVTAPILEAQLVESRIVNLLHFQSVIASKAARCVCAARGRRVVDFGMRRAHGAEAAIFAARAAYLAGFDATATVEAGHLFGIPLSGTMAHSFIQAHDSEEEALRRFVGAGGRATTVLIDTYDTERAALRVATLARELKASRAPGQIQAVRIDSGNLTAEACAVRRILDAQQCPEIDIILSGGLDEIQIDTLLVAGTPVDGFGIGTRLDCSEDAPSLDMVYKLQEYAGKPRRKRSRGKETWPGTKQVFRERDASGTFTRDSIALADETPSGDPLLQEILRRGQRVASLPSLAESREHCRRSLMQLPDELRELSDARPVYPIMVSDRVRALAHRVDQSGE